MNNSLHNPKLTSPTLLVSKSKCHANIKKMAEKAADHGLELRPHFKTHADKTIGNWFSGFGVSKITVSSVEMAQYFAQDGWQDILIAFPFNVLQIREINTFPSLIDLHLTVCSAEAAEIIGHSAKRQFGIYIKVDTGYGRTGLTTDELPEIIKILKSIHHNEFLTFSGFITHAGNTYKATNKDEVIRAHNDSRDYLLGLKSEVLKLTHSLSVGENEIIAMVQSAVLSVGDTPSCSIADDFEGIDEIRPGNFVFYDVMQTKIGSCAFDEIAVVLACPVVAKHEKRLEIVIHGGAVHLSKDSITDDKGRIIYGLVVLLTENGWTAPLPDTFLSSLSQEHGIIKAGEMAFNQINTGTIIGILPVHSCLTMASMKCYKLVY